MISMRLIHRFLKIGRSQRLIRSLNKNWQNWAQESLILSVKGHGKDQQKDRSHRTGNQLRRCSNSIVHEKWFYLMRVLQHWSLKQVFKWVNQ